MQPDNLWAPWRLEYLRKLSPDDAPKDPTKTPPCFLCLSAEVDVPSALAAQRLVLVNDERGQILLNQYPYTNGHLLIAPREHLADLADLSPQDRANVMELNLLAERLLFAAVHAQGINIGCNIGRCAGAGVPGHLHFHVVPRWPGDVNFITTIANVRVIPDTVKRSYDHLTMTLAKLNNGAVNPSHDG